MQVKFDRVTADYQLGPIRTKNVIDDVTLDIEAGSFTAVIGETGAGKSSLLRLINGLLLPSSGVVQVGDVELSSSKEQKQLSNVRKRVGMVFQFPENQLFAETVAEDIAFGPTNFGFDEAEIEERVKSSLKQVGLSTDLLERSPFALSGGQQRRVAVAGVLATKPDVIVLDEPGAGLDSEGKRQILSLIKELNQQEQLTVLLVTHDMDDVAEFADHVLLMSDGQVIDHQPTRSFFAIEDQIDKWRIELPEVIKLQRQIEVKKKVKLSKICLTRSELIDCLIEEDLL